MDFNNRNNVWSQRPTNELFISLFKYNKNLLLYELLEDNLCNQYPGQIVSGMMDLAKIVSDMMD